MVQSVNSAILGHGTLSQPISLSQWSWGRSPQEVKESSRAGAARVLQRRACATRDWRWCASPAAQRNIYIMSMAALLVMAGSSGFAAKPDYNVLNRRIASNQLEEETVSCILLDTMVPRQRINYQFGPPISEGLQEAKEDGRCIGILGMNFKNGQILRRGVEARIESMSPYMKTDGYFSSHSISPFDAPNMRGYTALDTTLVGGRRFELVVEHDERGEEDVEHDVELVHEELV